MLLLHSGIYNLLSIEDSTQHTQHQSQSTNSPSPSSSVTKESSIVSQLNQNKVQQPSSNSLNSMDLELQSRLKALEERMLKIELANNNLTKIVENISVSLIYNI